MRKYRGLALGALLVTVPLGGCFPAFMFEDDREREEWVPLPQPTVPPPQQTTNPPSIDSVEIADWPPIGRSTGVRVRVSDPDGNLSMLTFQFKNLVQRGASGPTEVAIVLGSQLGEGFGSLTIWASDTTGATARREVLNLLVDLSPPTITLGQTVVAADANLELWVGDAWILGKVELDFADEVLTHVFEPGYPKTVGSAWDYSLVKFPMSELPAVEGKAVLTATDAAGNAATKSFDLVIDGEPPIVAITSPAEGATLTGTISVTVTASDPGDGPVWLELSLGGTPIATGTGPAATFAIDTTEFAPGPALLVATATDRAGNQTVAKRSIAIQ
jgi:hypothetical protein